MASVRIEEARRASNTVDFLADVVKTQKSDGLVVEELERLRAQFYQLSKIGPRSLRFETDGLRTVYDWAGVVSKLDPSLGRPEVALETRLAIGGHLHSKLPEIKDLAVEEEKDAQAKKQGQDKTLGVVQKVAIATGALGALGAVVIGGNAISLRETDPEVNRMEGAVSSVASAQSNLRWGANRVINGVSQEKFAEPQKAVVDMDKALAIQVPKDVAERLTSIRDQVSGAFPGRIYIGDDPSLSGYRARLQEEREVLKGLANSKKEEIGYPHINFALGGLAVLGASLVVLWESLRRKNEVAKRFSAGEDARKRNIGMIDRADIAWNYDLKRRLLN